MCFWPSDSGRFSIQQHDSGCSFQVMGEELPLQPAAASTTATNSPYTSGPSTSGLSFVPQSSKSPVPSGNPVTPKSTWGKRATFSCKIIYATMQKNAKGIVQFNDLKQTFITLDENANLPEVTTKVRAKFGNQCILVAGNGLPIEDEAGTRGKLDFHSTPLTCFDHAACFLHVCQDLRMRYIFDKSSAKVLLALKDFKAVNKNKYA